MSFIAQQGIQHAHGSVQGNNVIYRKEENKHINVKAFTFCSFRGQLFPSYVRDILMNFMRQLHPKAAYCHFGVPFSLQPQHLVHFTRQMKDC